MNRHQALTRRKFVGLTMLDFVLTFLLIFPCNNGRVLYESGSNLKPVPCAAPDCIEKSSLENGAVVSKIGINATDASRYDDTDGSRNESPSKLLFNSPTTSPTTTEKLKSGNLGRKSVEGNIHDRVKNLADTRPENSVDTRESLAKHTSASSSSNFVVVNNSTKDKLKNTFIKRLPKALIIGVKKGGTKALLTFLNAHPDVRVHKKEVHFFDKYYDKGLKWYMEKMPLSFPHEITIEKSPRYLTTRQAPKRVFQMSPNMKLLVILRDPTNRAISDFVHMKTRKKRFQISESLESLIFNNNNSKTEWPINKTYAFIQNGLYSLHLKNWLKYFPRRNFHFVNGDEMITNPGKELLKVQEFLRLEPLVDEQNFVYNATKRFFCVYKTLQDRREKSQNSICLGKSKGRKHPSVSEKTLQVMREFYRPYNEELYRMTGINFGWK